MTMTIEIYQQQHKFFPSCCSLIVTPRNVHLSAAMQLLMAREWTCTSSPSPMWAKRVRRAAWLSTSSMEPTPPSSRRDVTPSWWDNSHFLVYLGGFFRYYFTVIPSLLFYSGILCSYSFFHYFLLDAGWKPEQCLLIVLWNCAGCSNQYSQHITDFTCIYRCVQGISLWWVMLLCKIIVK